MPFGGRFINSEDKQMAEKQRVLIVDDDVNIAELIYLYLIK